MKRIYQGLGTFLKDKRLKTNITQLEAALEIGHATAQYVSNFEREICDPSLDAAITLCKLYGVPKKELEEEILKIARKNIKRRLEGVDL